MSYNIIIRLHGSIIPTPDYENCDYIDMIPQLRSAAQQYPQEQGHSISIQRIGSTQSPIDLHMFLEAALSGDDKDIVALFFHQDEYDAFVNQRRVALPNDPHFKLADHQLEDVKNLVCTLVYPDDLHILKIDNPEGDPDPYPDYLPYVLPGYPADHRSDKLEDLEKILYHFYLTDGW